MKKSVVYLVTGPTSSGKTEYAVKLAKKFNGEIISADSRQVYKGMRIGTGAPTLVRGSYKGIKHHLIGIASPTKPYTVFDFQKDAFRLIDEIQKRNKIPIVVGGTGLWIRSLKEGLDFAQTKPDLKLREQLEKELKEKGLEYLVKKLRNITKEQRPPLFLPLAKGEMQEGVFDYHNPRRVIRALEIALSEKPAHQLTRASAPNHSFKTIHLSPPKDVLQKRINKRVDQMIKDGLVEEVKGLLKKYHVGKPSLICHPKFNLGSRNKNKQKKDLVGFLFSGFHVERGMAEKVWRINNKRLSKYPALTGIGYREIIDYLQGKTTLSEVVELIKLHTRQYAKRQITWFNKYH